MDMVIRFVVVIKLGKLANVVDDRIKMNFGLKIWKYGYHIVLNFNFLYVYLCAYVHVKVGQ